MIAGFLHDVLEDPNVRAPLVQGRLRAVVPRLASAPDGGAGFRAAVEEHIEHAFGRRVLELVRHVTEQKLDDRGEKRPWLDRKLDQLGALEDADTEHCALKAADCLDSLRSLSRDLRAHGSSVMDRFNASLGAQLWYYGRVTDLVSRRLGDTAGLAGELIAALREFGDAGIDRRAGRRPIRALAPSRSSLRCVSTVLEMRVEPFGPGGLRIHGLCHWFCAAPPKGGQDQWKTRAWSRADARPSRRKCARCSGVTG